MTEQQVEIGRREANKQATRRALRDAATVLFEHPGYEQTTVRDIAARAGVTERTFFRYFESKEDLVADRTLEWLPLVAEAIVARPAAESPLCAIREALVELTRAAGVIDLRTPTPVWLFTEGPPAPRLRRSAAALLVKFETALADAVRARMADGFGADFRAEVVARTAVAMCRSAYIRDWQLRSAGVPDRPPLCELLADAFAVLAED
ncbi:MAG TPA: TetR family transcriptional regulator [Pseudonocardiaceae bacterium]|nr:TetR family transcriptional regulator [Pseudonocardiaceae bacterium]